MSRKEYMKEYYHKSEKYQQYKQEYYITQLKNKAIEYADYLYSDKPETFETYKNKIEKAKDKDTVRYYIAKFKKIFSNRNIEDDDQD